MTLTNPIWKVNTTFSSKNISAGTSVYTYTADGDYKITIDGYATVAGGGDYIVWLTHQYGGAGTAHEIGPRTTITPTGTDLAFSSKPYIVKSGDVINIMIDGLAGDTSVSGGIRISVENYSIFDPATDTVISSASDPLLNNVPGTYNAGTAGAALGRIGSGQISTTSIVAQNGDVETYRGDSYADADARRIDWTDTSANWPTLTGASILVVIGGDVSFAGSVITATGASKKVGLELTSAQSATIPQGKLDFVVVATLASGNQVTLLEGIWTSKKQLVVGS